MNLRVSEDVKCFSLIQEMMFLKVSLSLSLSAPVLTPADEENHINKTVFKIPFVCGARNLGEALRRIAEGAAMIRTKGEAGTGQTISQHFEPSSSDPRTPRWPEDSYSSISECSPIIYCLFIVLCSLAVLHTDTNCHLTICFIYVVN